MNETQRNIKQYKAALPGLRERIAASAMLLLVSLSLALKALSLGLCLPLGLQNTQKRPIAFFNSFILIV